MDSIMGLTSGEASQAEKSSVARGPEGLHTPTASRCIFCCSPGVLLPHDYPPCLHGIMLANSLRANHPLVL